MTAYLMVRACVADASDRDAFDRWYEQEHLRDATRAFNANRSWRGWSEVEPLVHFAFYEFDSMERAKAIGGSAEITALIAEFDETWGTRVTRTRDFVGRAQTFEGGT